MQNITKTRALITNKIRTLKDNNNMKKFNKMESNLICDALFFYVNQLEKDIIDMEEAGKRSIFAPGFYTRVSQELAEKVKSMTKKQRV